MAALVQALISEERVRFAAEVTWKLSYGTAGFRDKAERLDRALFRVGVLAALRSKVAGATIGVVITASHNPVQDNGVKVVDPLGEMLAQEWEKYASLISNASTDDLSGVLCKIIEATSCDLSKKGHVIFARDTRPSGERLAEHLVRAVQLTGCDSTDYGILTTPQLHYIVKCINTNGVFGEPTEDGYYQKLISAFNELLPKGSPNCKSIVKVDGANGVGAMKMMRLQKSMQSTVAGNWLDICVYNYGSMGILNKDCGADFVKSQQIAPKGFDFGKEERCASIDGDGDRIVYFSKTPDERFQLMDGDKIAALVTRFIVEKLNLLDSNVSIGVVQTAYSNGSATAYLQNELKVPVVCTYTGVKNLHHKALEFDVGIYFESNGHGTVLFSQRAVDTFQSTCNNKTLPRESREAAQHLLTLSQLINQAVGDAISDLLLVEMILIHNSWNVCEWSAIYKELPNRQLKVRVRDRMAIKTADFERRCIAPESLQLEITALVSKVSSGRCFIRPSGTEDVVRVYAEAETQDSADTLAVLVGRKVYQIAGGIGDIPSLPTVML